MRTVIHDLEKKVFSSLGILCGDTIIFCAGGRYAHCQGCFGCWLKQPGFCTIKDPLQHAGALIGQSDPLVIISRCCYGGYSSQIKAILDRSIGESRPFFTWKGGQTHHISRYPRRQSLKVCFYGDCTEFERQTASELVERNRLNLGFENAEVLFFQNTAQLKEAGL